MSTDDVSAPSVDAPPSSLSSQGGDGQNGGGAAPPAGSGGNPPPPASGGNPPAKPPGDGKSPQHPAMDAGKGLSLTQEQLLQLAMQVAQLQAQSKQSSQGETAILISPPMALRERLARREAPPSAYPDAAGAAADGLDPTRDSKVNTERNRVGAVHRILGAGAYVGFRIAEFSEKIKILPQLLVACNALRTSDEWVDVKLNVPKPATKDVSAANKQALWFAEQQFELASAAAAIGVARAAVWKEVRTDTSPQVLSDIFEQLDILDNNLTELQTSLCHAMAAYYVAMDQMDNEIGADTFKAAARALLEHKQTTKSAALLDEVAAYKRSEKNARYVELQVKERERANKERKAAGAGANNSQ